MMMNAAVDVLPSIISYQNAPIRSARATPPDQTFPSDRDKFPLGPIPRTPRRETPARKITCEKSRGLINAVLNYYSMMSATLIKNWLGYRNSWL